MVNVFQQQYGDVIKMINIIKDCLKPLSKAIKVCKDIGIEVNFYCEKDKVVLQTFSACNSQMSVVEIVQEGIFPMEPFSVKADKLLLALKGANKDSTMVINDNTIDILVGTKKVRLSIANIYNPYKLPALDTSLTIVCTEHLSNNVKEAKDIIKSNSISIYYNNNTINDNKDNNVNKVITRANEDGEEYECSSNVTVMSIKEGITEVSAMYDPTKFVQCFGGEKGDFIVSFGQDYPLIVSRISEGFTHKVILAPRVSNN